MEARGAIVDLVSTSAEVTYNSELIEIYVTSPVRGKEGASGGMGRQVRLAAWQEDNREANLWCC